MAYEFKNLSDVDQLDQLSGSTTIMGFDNGKPVQFSTDKVGSVKTVNGSVPDENGNIELQTASSWNDLTDKPFDENNIIKPEALPEGCPYKETEVVEVLPEETIALAAMNDADNTIYTAMFSTVPHIVDGHTYAVYIDGHRFETTAFTDGNSNNMVFMTDNGTVSPDSWMIQVAEEEMVAGLMCLGMPSGSETVTIKIEEIVVVRSRKIDEDLLPDSVKGGGNCVIVFERYYNGNDFEISCRLSFDEVYNLIASRTPVIAVVYDYENNGGVTRQTYLQEISAVGSGDEKSVFLRGFLGSDYYFTKDGFEEDGGGPS